MAAIFVTEDDFSRCLLLNTIKTARVLSRRYDARLKPYGVTVAQFSVMMVVRHNAGETINALAEKIAMDRSTLSRNIDLLAARGLVVKDSSARGNAKTCRLTQSGGALLDALIPQWHAVREELQQMLKDRDPLEYLSALQALSKT